MVFFFVAKDGTQLYMGKDKFENEDLIKYGWPEDIWFHVDNLSSAHVYVRLAQGSVPNSASASGMGPPLSPPELLEIGNAVMDRLGEDVIRDCCQLVKENSIEGCKKASVTVVYTPWYNLKKTGGMEAGQVGFHNERLVRKFLVLEKDRDTIRRIEKSRAEKHPDLKTERETRDLEERAKVKAEQKAKAAADRDLAEERKKDKEARSYDRLFEKKEESVVASGKGGKKKGGKYEDRGGDLAGDFGALGIKPTADTSAAKAAEEDFM